MISHELKCIFIHIPKCAGTSIESALGHHDDYSGRDRQDHRSIRMIERPLLNIYTLRSFGNITEFLRMLKHKKFNKSPNPRNSIVVNKAQYHEYFKFTIVRNPWARAFSWYQNVMRDEGHQRSLGITAELSFKSFLTAYAGTGMLTPQTYWIKNYKGDVGLDYVGRFEELEQVFSEIQGRLQLEDLEFPHEVKGNKADYKLHYDDESADLIKKIYSEEIRLFGYSIND